VKVKQWSIACRTSSELDFSQNRAEHDDILGDAYEYLMRHFATQSGKSKGQFYTPAEVSRVIAKVIGISPENAKASTTAYDPTCGSGSLLLKVAPQAHHTRRAGEGRDHRGLGPHEHDPARLSDGKYSCGQHVGCPQVQGRRAASNLRLRRRQSAFLRQDLEHRPHTRKGPIPALRLGRAACQAGRLCLPVAHLRSTKGAGKAACILPHGVLFRGHAEATIRQQLVRSGS
jgi:type I restriction enzyme M protein